MDERFLFSKSFQQLMSSLNKKGEIENDEHITVFQLSTLVLNKTFQEKNRTRSIKNGFDAKKRIINKQEPKLLKLALQSQNFLSAI